MGPGDPFAPRRPSSTPPPPPPASDSHPSAPRPRSPSGVGPLVAPLVGLLFGAGVGGVGWFAGAGAALVIVASGLVGMGLIWLVFGAATGALDWQGALRVLLRRRDLR